MTTPDAPLVLIERTHREPDGADLTGLEFRIEYEETIAHIAILDMAPLPFQDRVGAFRAVIEDLARALMQAIKIPDRITDAPIPVPPPADSDQ